MEQFIISGRKFAIKNPEQIINMGGPWVGELELDGETVTSDVIVDNLIYHPYRNWLLFIKYSNPSKWMVDNYFSIVTLDLKSNQLYKYDEHFDAIYLKSVIDNDEIEIYRAFHDKMSNRREIFNLTKSSNHRIHR